MRTIARTPNPPSCLAAQPSGLDWGGFIGTPCHAAVALSLRQEQHALCCYCEVGLAERDCHIDYMQPRSEPPPRTFDYNNLALSCNGGAVEHCGHFKDDRHRNPTSRWNSALFSPPHDADTAGLFRYLPDGSVLAAPGADNAKATYAIGYLGLGCARLMERRKQHARELIDTLGAQPDPEVVAWAQGYYLQPNGAGSLKQFHSLSRAILDP